MNNYLFNKHVVNEAKFIEKTDFDKNNEVEINIDGGVSVPKDGGRKVIVHLNCHLGSENERIYLYLGTDTIFDIQGEDELPSSAEAQKNCLPKALECLRKTIKNVMESFGRPGVDLPPFEEEMNS